jgi:pilus assembly protein CpaB
MKGKAPLIVAGILGILAALLAYQTIKHNEMKAREGLNPVPVLVAARDMQEGTVLSYDLVARSTMPEKFVTGSVVPLGLLEKVMDQRLAVPLKAGDPIMWNHFRSEANFDRLSSIVRTQGRAFSMDFSGTSAVAGWVRPGDRVDILGTFQDPKDSQMVSVTLMQDVTVLATGNLTAASNPILSAKDPSSYGNVTLWVLPEEAEILALASELGKLRLSLRNPSDMGLIEQDGRTTRDTVFNGQRMKERVEVRNKIDPRPVIYRLDEKSTSHQ